jgi:hypothetical protein
MNTVTATFSNLDFKNFDQYKEDAAFLGLSMIRFRVEDFKLVTFDLKGNYEMIKTFTTWINNPQNWTDEALEDNKIMEMAEFYQGDQE